MIFEDYLFKESTFEELVANEENNGISQILDLCTFFADTDLLVFNLEYLTSIFDKLTNLGSVVIQMPYESSKFIYEVLKLYNEKQPKTNLLLKVIFEDKDHLNVFVLIQKFELKSEIKFEGIKLLLSRFTDKGEIVKVNTMLLSDFNSCLDYVFQFNKTALHLKEVML